MAVSFAEALIRRCPPWLQRAAGRALMGGLGDPLDVVRDKTAEAVDARFPRAIRPDALPYIGRDRVIRRGLNEPAETYATRLKRWLTDHKTRGNAYALMRQLEAYFATDPVRLELVYNSGTRYTLDPTTLDADGLGAITRDSIVWGGNGIPAKWAEQWLFIRYDLNPSMPVITQAMAESVNTICDEWSAAHMLRTHAMVVAEGACEVWDYPPGLLWDDGSGDTWDAPDCFMFDSFDGPSLVTWGGDYVTFGGDHVVVN
jgi:hypothetical protein